MPSAAQRAQQRGRRRRAAGGDPDRGAAGRAASGCVSERRSARSARALKWVTPCVADQLATPRAGSTLRRHTWVPPAAVTAQVKHQPLQWNIGSVHRYADVGGRGRCARHRQRLQVGAAVVVHHALGPPGGAARVVQRQQRALVVDRCTERRRVPPAGARVRRPPSTRQTADRRLGDRAAATAIEVASASSNAAPACSTMSRSSPADEPRVQGHEHARPPWARRSGPRAASGELGASTATRSPGPTPSAASAPASRRSGRRARRTWSCRRSPSTTAIRSPWTTRPIGRGTRSASAARRSTALTQT